MQYVQPPFDISNLEYCFGRIKKFKNFLLCLTVLSCQKNLPVLQFRMKMLDFYVNYLPGYGKISHVTIALRFAAV